MRPARAPSALAPLFANNACPLHKCFGKTPIVNCYANKKIYIIYFAYCLNFVRNILKTFARYRIALFVLFHYAMKSIVMLCLNKYSLHIVL